MLTAFAAVVALTVTVGGCSESDEKTEVEKPIVVGSTLSLTGAFAATAQLHKIAGEEFVARLNAGGGLLGRKVQWKVLDDQSDPARTGRLYEQLIKQEKVDLLMGPYATPNIMAAMAVAERHEWVLPQHTAVLAPMLTYGCQFPAWSIGATPNSFIPNQLFDAVASLPTPPKRIAVLTNESGSAAFVSDGLGKDKSGTLSIAKERGLKVVVDVHYPPTTTDWAPIAAQLRDADPDLIIDNGLGVDLVNIMKAMKKLKYQPKRMFSLFPAPGPLLALGEQAEGVLSISMFEPNKPTLDQLPPEAAEITAEFTARAKAAELPYTVFESQAAASWNAWEILADGVGMANSTDQGKICSALHDDGADTTFSGHLTFRAKDHNFWSTTQMLKQIQNGEWVTVWPPDRAAARLE
ncbi:amino acid ABC transporter substrate-binding protein [Actinoplanes sp. NPDC049802]|uniref:amino acid ABC transporter substrate-binding protein n=1 Tax=Actinoplanes sp. NPDC049802 TaxID=3154742 RepID=UPI0033CEBFF6